MYRKCILNLFLRVAILLDYRLKYYFFKLLIPVNKRVKSNRYVEEFASKNIYVLSYLLHGFFGPAPGVAGDVLQLDALLIAVSRCENDGEKRTRRRGINKRVAD